MTAPADLTVIVSSRAARRRRRLAHIAEVHRGVRAGLSLEDALERADLLHHERCEAVARAMREGVS